MTHSCGINIDKDWRVEDHWKIEDLPWDKLDPDKVSPDLLKVIKAAALVEYNAEVYAKYLCQVFPDDEHVQDNVNTWSNEEVQHGQALGLWAERIDPKWDLEKAMKKFRAGYNPEHFITEVSASVRGSRAGEMVARCMVEVGTSSYYSAIGHSCEEPVLKEICKLVAGDEFRHYKCFYDIMHKYIKEDNLTKFGRLKVAVGRISEGEDDELAYAYFAANASDDEVYDRKKYSREYLGRAYSYYKKQEVDRAVSMIFKACGFKPQTIAYKTATKFAWWKFESEARRLQKAAA
ncbi:MAG: hypothetical protein DHS20C02_15730 [Micavibrio sp.]|nr:MAG: hypothetical protein DHS20C02_15730 [Micavibrio sp.]